MCMHTIRGSKIHEVKIKREIDNCIIILRYIFHIQCSEFHILLQGMQNDKNNWLKIRTNISRLLQIVD